MRAPERPDPAWRLPQPLAEVRIISRLQPEHPRDQLQAVLHPMVDLLQKHLVVLERDFESLLLALPFDRHPQDICRALEKSDVSFAELAWRSAVHFEHTARPTLALPDTAYSSPDTMRCKEIRRSKPVLVFQMVRNHRLPCAQCIA